MSETSGFFTSVAGDRRYTAQFMNEKLHEAMQRAEGVVPGSDGELYLSTDGTLSIDISPGSAFKQGIYYRNPSNLHLPLTAPSLGTKRYDRVVVRIDRYQRTMKIHLIQGAESATPQLPAYDEADDLRIGYVLINHLTDPAILTVYNERQMRPLFITSEHSIDMLKEGTVYGRVLKEKADAINAGQIGISVMHFNYVGRACVNPYFNSVYLAPNSFRICTGRGIEPYVHISDDGGATWQAVSSSIIPVQINAVAGIGSTFLAAGGSPACIYRYSFGTWMKVYENTEKELVTAFCIIDSQNMLACCMGMILKSTNGGASWSQIGTIPSAQYVDRIEHLGNGVVLACAVDTEKIYRSTDGGSTWTEVKYVNDGQNSSAFISHVGNGVVLLGYKGKGKLYRSTDYGVTWNNGVLLDEEAQLACILVEGSSILLPVGKDIMESTDKGITWHLKYPNANIALIIGMTRDPYNRLITLGYWGHVFWGSQINA